MTLDEAGLKAARAASMKAAKEDAPWRPHPGTVTARRAITLADVDFEFCSIAALEALTAGRE